MRQEVPYKPLVFRIRTIGNKAATIMGVPSGKQPEPGPFARAIAAEVRAAMGRHKVSTVLLASRAGMSRTYLGRRLRDEVSLTFNDVEAICTAIREDLPGLIDAAFKRLDQGKEK